MKSKEWPSCIVFPDFILALRAVHPSLPLTETGCALIIESL